MKEITAFFNSVSNVYNFACIPGTEKRVLWVKNGYQVERSIKCDSPCGNMIYGDYFLYKGDFDDESWTCQDAINKGLIFQEKPKQSGLVKKESEIPNSVKIGIFLDASQNRHALPSDVYDLFRKSKFWNGCQHIATVTRTNLDERTVKAIIKSSKDFNRVYQKSGMFDLVKQNWTFGGEVARTDKQANGYNNHLTDVRKRLNTWERSMKRMDMIPSAANSILGNMSSKV